jgi:SWI/SNF-related matrix-associated actin-dependent regulator of chromatin subfamily A-like protein 1
LNKLASKLAFNTRIQFAQLFGIHSRVHFACLTGGIETRNFLVMALDEETKRKIELNRLEALKRLEERKRRLENANPEQTNSHAQIANVPVIKRLQTMAPSNHVNENAITKPIDTPSTTTTSSATSSTTPSSSSLSSTVIRPLAQLASCKSFTITGTNAVKRVCRGMISEVLYNQTDNTYTVPLDKYTTLMDKLVPSERPQGHQQIPKPVLTAFEPGQIHQRNAANAMDYKIEETIGSGLYNSLFPYQREGVRMAIARRGRLIIADEMGLGKSIQAIAIAAYFRREWPMLILAPASMVASWQQQIIRWLPESLLSPAEIQVIYDGKTKTLDGTVTILSYDLAVKFGDLIEKRKFGIVIADECHALRNIETKRSKTLVPLISAANRVLMLSGTPALSRPIELFPQIQVINAKLFPKRHDYALRYCDAHKQYFGGWDMRGSSNLTELQVVLENCVMIRRMKDQVLTELPPKIRRQVFLKIPSSSKNFKMFQLQTTEYLNNIGMADDPEASLQALESIQKKAEFMALWKRTAEIKLDAMIEYVEDLLDANHKMLIFAHHTSIIDGFSSHFLSKVHTYIF